MSNIFEELYNKENFIVDKRKAIIKTRIKWF